MQTSSYQKFQILMCERFVIFTGALKKKSRNDLESTLPYPRKLSQIVQKNPQNSLILVRSKLGNKKSQEIKKSTDSNEVLFEDSTRTLCRQDFSFLYQYCRRNDLNVEKRFFSATQNFKF